MMEETKYRTVCYYGDGRALHALWNSWEGWEQQPFVQRRDTFLWIVERLLREGRIKLHKKGVFLATSVEEQVETFRASWPASEHPYPNHPGAGFDLWFFDPECPAGVAWPMPDGGYQIAD